MYAKLVIGGSNVYPSRLIRDIVSLCTSANPSTSDLSGSGFSTTSSVIIDNTPAGWSYVNSTLDGLTLGSGTIPSVATYDWWAIKAPCLLPSGSFKFAVLKIAYTDSLTQGSFAISGAESVATGSTTITNLGSNPNPTTAASAATFGTDVYMGFSSLASQTFHLIATPRMLLLIKEDAKFNAILEFSASEAHQFYNTPAFLQYMVTSGTLYSGTSTPGTLGGQTLTGTSGVGNIICLETFDWTDPNTTTNYGVLSFGGPDNGSATLAGGLGHQPYIWPAGVTTTIAANGATRNIVKPMIIQAFSYGMPTCWVTGVSDIWMTRGSAGTTGDTMTINGQTYTYFNVIASSIASGRKSIGFAINTSQTA